MIRGPLFETNYTPQFAGHETFPLRHGWLKKAFDAVRATEDHADNREVFGDRAIADFGVGKNMVGAMRHWATVTGIIEDRPSDDGKGVRTTRFGRMLLAHDGLDPYMEHPATLWLIHWQLAGGPEKTTWYWVFNYYADTTFERDHLVQGLTKLAAERGWRRAATATIRRDVECFVRTYAERPTGKSAGLEDALESPLTELGLIRPVGRKDGFRLVRGSKLTLTHGVFSYALIDFWSQLASNARTLSFEALAHEPGSPGRVLLLDENDLAERLNALDEVTDGAFRWSETAGLKQVIRETELDREAALAYVARDYQAGASREAA